MKLEFETDINGYQEARKFKLLVDSILKHEELDQSLSSLATSLQQQLQEFLSNPEFADFTDSGSEGLYTASHDESVGTSVSRFFSGLFGPSKREIELSKQRQALIARAEHAEQSAFEALAETGEIGRERDELKEKLKQLEAQLENSK
ncbi:MAG: hypothetical protein ACPHLK_09610 [Gammaproteobacteria bacterium]|jgi:hypothetical protein